MKTLSNKTTGAARRVLSGAAAEAPKSTGLPMNTSPADEWALPAIRGVQARHEYFVVLVQLNELPRLLAPIDAKVLPELRAQRGLNKARVPRIAEYILGNPNDYTSPPWSVPSTACPASSRPWKSRGPGCSTSPAQ